MKKFWLMTIILILSSFVFSQEARKMDEVGDINCEDYLARMDGLRSLINDPNSKIYILIYEGKESRYNSKKNKTERVFPAYGSAKARILSIRNYFKSNKQEKSLEQIVFVEAGFREGFSFDFWSVPNGATPPTPTPTLKKMKYRKGKPKGFCAGCC